MSRFFDQPTTGGETKELLPPDYSEAENPTEDDDEDDDSSITDIDETQEDEIITTKEEEKKVVTTTFGTTQSTPFGNPVTTPTPTWGSSSSVVTPTPTWGSGGATTPNPSTFWTPSQPATPRPTWGSGGTTTPTWGAGSSTNTTGKTEIDRSKRVLIVDFLDTIVETYQSNGCPGLIPRDIYDLKPRLDVWAKLSAYAPEMVVILIPLHLIVGTLGTPAGWECTTMYYSLSLASFLRLPYYSCQTQVQFTIGEPKEVTIGASLSRLLQSVDKKDIVYIGINSGRYGQGNQDIVAAQNCGIDYVDLLTLMNNMY